MAVYASGASLVAADASAAIVYTDLGPNGVTLLPAGNYEATAFDVDLNQDGAPDYEIAVSAHTRSLVEYGLCYASNAWVRGLTDMNRVFGFWFVTSSGLYSFFAPRLAGGDEIDQVQGGGGATLHYREACEEPRVGPGPSNGAFSDARGFLGLLFGDLDGEVHTGWVELEVTTNESQMSTKIHGFAYQDTPDVPILAGDKGVSPNVPGDTNGDGNVDLADLNNVRNNFGASGDGILGDTNGDDLVDLEDLNAVRNNFGTGNPVPEPPSLVLLAAGAAGLAVLRRKRKEEQR